MGNLFSLPKGKKLKDVKRINGKPAVYFCTECQCESEDHEVKHDINGYERCPVCGSGLYLKATKHTGPSKGS